jgi:hypothetical protein
MPVDLLGFSIFHKMIAALWMLAYDYPADSMDDTLHMVKMQSIECTKVFAETVVNVYGESASTQCQG